MTAALASLVSFLAAPNLLAVRVESELAGCPARSEVEAALAQVLGQGASDAAGWVLRYDREPAAATSGHEVTLAVKLVTPAGQAVVDRRITVDQADCPVVAHAIAAVAERSLHTIGWTRGDPLPTPAPVATPATNAVARDRPPAVAVGFGPSLGLRSGEDGDVGGNLLLQARVRLLGPFCIRLGTWVLSTNDDRKVGNAVVQATSRFASAAPLLAFVRGRTEMAVGPVLLFGFDSATSNLGGSGDRVTLAMGLAASVAIRLSGRWRISVGLEGTRAALGGDYVVDLNGIRTVVLAPPPWRGMATTQLEFLPWP